jgi:GxxExxY protein
VALEHDHLINDILDAALAVHSCLGCGFIESIYGRALATELRQHDLQIEREKLIKIRYGSHVVGKHFLDLVVNETVIVELKAARGIIPVHTAQLRSYLHATGYSAGLILNFGRPELQWEHLSEYRPSLEL